MNKRMNRTKLNIGTYFLAPYANTENHVRELAECGINLVICMHDDRKTLDLFEKYNVGAVVTGILPKWWGGDGDNASKMAERNPIEQYVSAAESFIDHPAICGIDTGDEPSALDFPHYGKVIDTVNKGFPNQFAYLNLYPNYASVSQNNATETVNQLGTPTYAEHIEKYCENVGTDYICYDFYMYSASIAGAYENLRIVSDACLRTGRDMWIVLQVNSNREAEWISENQLRFQAYSAMAFGAETIIWACYTAGWWYNQVLDKEGEKTEQYDKLKTVNAELIKLGDIFMKYRRVSTHFIGFEDGLEYFKNVNQKAITSLNTGIFNDLHAENGENILVGQMVSRINDNSYALMICGADDPQDKQTKSYAVQFKADGKEVTAFDGNGEVMLTKDVDGYYSFGMKSCDGVIVIAN